MRLSLPMLLACGLLACGRSPAPTPADADATADAPAAAAPEAPAARVAGEVVRDLAAALLAATATDDDRARAVRDAEATAGAVLAAAADGDVQATARAPGVLIALGDGALPAIVAGLSAPATRQRRIAAMTLLQLADSLHERGGDDAVAAGLQAARTDADAAVAATAELALRRVTGDRSALDKSRAENAAAEQGR